uniref:Uncharacterized protein n=1 Tax=Rhodococcus sp. NS1 TaxID=402236 RepID=A0A097SPW3_9NOCA|nr:hypothetical protein LRS1606.131 [Rhodococcus sp. NS1]
MGRTLWRGISQADHVPQRLAGSPSTFRPLAQSVVITAVITCQQLTAQTAPGSVTSQGPPASRVSDRGPTHPLGDIAAPPSVEYLGGEVPSDQIGHRRRLRIGDGGAPATSQMPTDDAVLTHHPRHSFAVDAHPSPRSSAWMRGAPYPPRCSLRIRRICATVAASSAARSVPASAVARCR